MDPLAGDDDRPLGRDQRRGDLRDRPRVGPLLSRGVFWYSSGPLISSRKRSDGNSISTGPGRPFLTWVKARRSASTVASGTVTCSIHLVTWRKFSAALKFGRTWLTLRA